MLPRRISRGPIEAAAGVEAVSALARATAFENAMHIDKLISALSRLGIAEVRSETHHAHGTVYLIEGRLPTPPFARRHALISYEMRLSSGGVFVEPDDIDSMLFHLWQGQYDIRDLQRDGDPGV